MPNYTKFDKSVFQHLEPIDTPGGKKKLPLCNLMDNGRCVNNYLLLTNVDGSLDWEGPPNINSCIDCEFHKLKCERC